MEEAGERVFGFRGKGFGLGFRAGLGFRVSGVGFTVWGLGLRVWKPVGHGWPKP